jgi:hypothetical protein
MWAAAHLALFTLAWISAWAFGATLGHPSLTCGFEQLDAIRLRNIAQHGYFSPGSIAHNVAFFPGYPITLAVTHVLLHNWVLSELAVSGVAGCFVVVSLSRLAGTSRAVRYLLTAPAAMFLLVGYSECLFLALAIPAWQAAVRGQWRRAALLAGLSGVVRPDALFLVPALALMALRGPRGSRLPGIVTACSALAGPVAYEVYLTVSTGTWRGWQLAQQEGWGLHLVTPVQALRDTWIAASSHFLAVGVAFELQMELAAMAAMLIATFLFLWWYKSPEAMFCGLAALALGTETWYQTSPRTLLVLFPIWVALAGLDRRLSWFRYAWTGLSTPLAVAAGLLYLSGHFTG